jgi:hypothetical protein
MRAPATASRRRTGSGAGAVLRDDDTRDDGADDDRTDDDPSERRSSERRRWPLTRSCAGSAVAETSRGAADAEGSERR